jgi:hypothetical protein
MTGLGLTTGAPAGQVSGSTGSGRLKHFKVALSSAGGAAIVLAGFELLQKQPTEGFKLLGQWGPWPLIVLVALVMAGSFFSKLNDTISTSFSAIVTSAQQGVEVQSKGVEAQSKTADALSRLADQGNKQAEEVRRLAIYAAREFPAMYDRFDQLDASIAKLTEGMKGLHWAVNVKGANGGEETNERGT